MIMHDYVMIAAILLALGVVLFFVRVISKDKQLQWTHLVSVEGRDGEQKASWHPIKEGIGAGLAVWVTIGYLYSPKMEWAGLVAILTITLGYLGGTAYAAARLRADSGKVITNTAIGDRFVTEEKTQ